MILVEVEQNTAEWYAARLGKPTSSKFSEIVTPGGKLSASSRRYLHHLLSEWITGAEVEAFQSKPMMDGFLLQPEATEYYQVLRSVDVVPGGFCLEDRERYGASPDGLVGDDGLLEIKAPKAHTHMAVLLSRTVPQEHWPQLQGQLLVTGRDWVDFLSYRSDMPAEVIRVERDEEYISLLRDAMEEFCDQLDAAKENLRSRGFYPATAPTESGTGSNGVPSEDAESD